MNILKKITATVTLLALAVSMTTPTFNAGDLDLPAAIHDVPESPTILRTGVVSEIAESNNITVKISGSNVLVTAAYLFPQYGPVLGDIVVVAKQDAQWFVLGGQSGPLNTLAANPSFENGVVGSTPTDWSITTVLSAGGVPTFTKVSTVEVPISGVFVADFGTDSVVAGLSRSDVFSDVTAASEDQRWTGAYYIALASIDQNATTGISGGRFSVLEFYIQFLDAGSGLISESLISTFGTNANVPSPVYVRPSVGTQFAQAPAGTAYARIKIRGSFDMSANSFTSFFLDYMILRNVT